MELIKRDRAHPSIIAWVPFNESWGVWHQSERPEQRAFVDAVTSLTKVLDDSRVVVGNDGWEYSSGDLWTLHLYNEDSDVSSRLAALIEDPHSSVTSEFGGRDRVGACPVRMLVACPYYSPNAAVSVWVRSARKTSVTVTSPRPRGAGSENAQNHDGYSLT